MNWNKIRGMYRLFRFELSFTAGTCVVMGEVFALGALPSPILAAYGFLSFFFIAATALILNDYFDLETDRINAPSRPLPSGLVTEGEVVVLSIGVALLGLLFSYLISVTALLVTCAVWLVGFLYNRRFKHWGVAGNLFVGFSVGMTFIFGGIVVGRPFEPIVWYLAITTLVINFGEEVAADALDVEGDRRTGSRSLAVRLGPQKAMNVAAAAFGTAVAGSTVPFLAGWLEWWYAPPILVLDAIIVGSAVNLLDADRPQRIRDIRRIYLGGLAVFLALIVIRLAYP